MTSLVSSTPAHAEPRPCGTACKRDAIFHLPSPRCKARPGQQHPRNGVSSWCRGVRLSMGVTGTGMLRTYDQGPDRVMLEHKRYADYCIPLHFCSGQGVLDTSFLGTLKRQ